MLVLSGQKEWLLAIHRPWPVLEFVGFQSNVGGLLAVMSTTCNCNNSIFPADLPADALMYYLYIDLPFGLELK